MESALRASDKPPPYVPTSSSEDRRLQFREIRELALALLALHQLNDWSFAFNWRKRSLGLCIFQQQRIEVSVYFVERNDRAEIQDTLLHEIAHALVGPGHGHDAVWRQKCVAIGARPVRCSQADMPTGRWQADCKQCRQHFHRHRRPKRIRSWFCRVCGPDAGRLVWNDNG
jgi:predicted SprT family Zn-dependent metalloprotease